MHLYIVTGSSRGLGAALLQQLVQPGHVVIGIARNVNPALQAEQWPHDLAEPLPAAEHLQAWLRVHTNWRSATLINNAALLSPPGLLAATGLAELSAALRVGLEAPVLLSAAFLRATAGWQVPRKLLFVSSGLGRRAMAGGASYCAVKAGMDHLARALALEQAAATHGARVVSLAPGVIDTAMQVQLRNADPVVFPEGVRFAAMKEGGQLDTPTAAAAKVLGYLARADFGSNPVADVRDA